MAIFSGATAGITASIVVNGIPVREHDCTEAKLLPQEDSNLAKYLEEHTVTKYIQSEDKEQFSIRLTLGDGYNRGAYMPDTRVSFEIYFDGVFISKASVHRRYFKDKDPGTRWEKVIDGVISCEGRENKHKKFMFKPLIVTSAGHDEKLAPVTQLAEEVSKIGIIRIEVHGETAGKEANMDKKIKNLEQPGGGRIPETAMKGEVKTHSIVFCDITKTKRYDRIAIAKRTSEDFPLAVFQFLYRDHDTLRKLQVLKDDASSSTPPLTANIINSGNLPLPNTQQITESMTNAYPPQIVTILQQIVQQEMSHLKASFSPHPMNIKAEETRLAIKREAVDEERERALEAKRARIARGEEQTEVIDLTDD